MISWQPHVKSKRRPPIKSTQAQGMQLKSTPLYHLISPGAMCKGEVTNSPLSFSHQPKKITKLKTEFCLKTENGMSTMTYYIAANQPKQTKSQKLKNPKCLMKRDPAGNRAACELTTRQNQWRPLHCKRVPPSGALEGTQCDSYVWCVQCGLWCVQCGVYMQIAQCVHKCAPHSTHLNVQTAHSSQCNVMWINAKVQLLLHEALRAFTDCAMHPLTQVTDALVCDGLSSSSSSPSLSSSSSPLSSPLSTSISCVCKNQMQENAGFKYRKMTEEASYRKQAIG